MSENDIEMARKFLDGMRQLPKEARYACIWACDNMDFVYGTVDCEPYSVEKIDALIQDCLERKDYVLLLLAVFKKLHDEGKMNGINELENSTISK